MRFPGCKSALKSFSAGGAYSPSLNYLYYSYRTSGSINLWNSKLVAPEKPESLGGNFLLVCGRPDDTCPLTTL